MVEAGSIARGPGPNQVTIGFPTRQYGPWEAVLTTLRDSFSHRREGRYTRLDLRLAARPVLERSRDRSRDREHPHLREGEGHRLVRAVGRRRPEGRARR